MSKALKIDKEVEAAAAATGKHKVENMRVTHWFDNEICNGDVMTRDINERGGNFFVRTPPFTHHLPMND